MCESKEKEYSKYGGREMDYNSDTEDDIDFCPEIDFY